MLFPPLLLQVFPPIHFLRPFHLPFPCSLVSAACCFRRCCSKCFHPFLLPCLHRFHHPFLLPCYPFHPCLHPCLRPFHHPYYPFLLPYHLLGSMVPSLVVPFLHHHPCFHPDSKEKVPCQVHPSFLLWVPCLPFLSSKVLYFLACSYFLSCFP